MMDPLPISQAAVVLGLSAARVRAMAVHGQLTAEKLGDRWFVERAAVERRRREGALEGRRFSPRNAWALLSLASGEEVKAIDPSVRSRLKRALSRDGLEKLGPRLARRAEVRAFRAHPGELAHLLADSQLVRTGVSAAGAQGLDVVPGFEADGYLRAAHLSKFVARHALEPAGLEGNVRLRVVPEGAEDFLDGKDIAPQAAIALDLSGEFDVRSAAAGEKALRELDRSWHERQAALQGSRA
jgi:hypothetical protein